jgi:hypothetical protein
VLEEENRSSYYMLLFSIKFLEDFAIQITAKKIFPMDGICCR